MEKSRKQTVKIGIIMMLVIIFSSCHESHESKPINNHGEIIGQTLNQTDSLVYIILHPNTVLDTIKVIDGHFSYHFPSLNYSRIKMTKADSTYQKGWCKNSNYRIVKMEILKKNGKKHSVSFLNSYFSQVEKNYNLRYLDALILDHQTIKVSIEKESNPGYFMKAKVEGSIETNKLFQRDHNFWKNR